MNDTAEYRNNSDAMNDIAEYWNNPEEFEITTEGNKPFRVWGETRGGKIGIHRIFQAYDYGEVTSYTYVFGLTHLATGRALCWVPSSQAAYEIADRILALWDDGSIKEIFKMICDNGRNSVQELMKTGRRFHEYKDLIPRG